ncbi:hypothetical protein RHSIM_Rhsim10G0076100 [Rhododendron simsii]|uniref:Uncharacterized protein n=1 Tax=Rhododendron simsii TaxID=118357 RepID=A0A834G8V2_RHOSS|nr:hypothetical protein RHSIM_Rhsim10G0076100 [Rhododendron simsii]
MEEALLLKNGDRNLVPIAPEAFVEELKKVTAIAAPMVVVTMSQYLLHVAPMIMVGHISELSVSSVSIATSLTNVTSYNVLVKLCLLSFFFFCFVFVSTAIFQTNMDIQPRPYSFNGSWQICNLANSLAISLHYSGISGSVLANSDIDMYFILVTN